MASKRERNEAASPRAASIAFSTTNTCALGTKTSPSLVSFRFESPGPREDPPPGGLSSSSARALWSTSDLASSAALSRSTSARRNDTSSGSLGPVVSSRAQDILSPSESSFSEDPLFSSLTRSYAAICSLNVFSSVARTAASASFSFFSFRNSKSAASAAFFAFMTSCAIRTNASLASFRAFCSAARAVLSSTSRRLKATSACSARILKLSFEDTSPIGPFCFCSTDAWKSNAADAASSCLTRRRKSRSLNDHDSCAARKRSSTSACVDCNSLVDSWVDCKLFTANDTPSRPANPAFAAAHAAVPVRSAGAVGVGRVGVGPLALPAPLVLLDLPLDFWLDPFLPSSLRSASSRTCSASANCFSRFESSVRSSSSSFFAPSSS